MAAVAHTVIITLLIAALCGFYSFAFVRPRMYGFLLKPAMTLFAGVMGLSLAFAVGAGVAGLGAVWKARADLPPPAKFEQLEGWRAARDAESAALDRARDYVTGLTYGASALAIAAALAGLIAQLLVPAANHQLRIEAEEQSRRAP